jgi:hypothetical protein
MIALNLGSCTFSAASLAETHWGSSVESALEYAPRLKAECAQNAEKLPEPVGIPSLRSVNVRLNVDDRLKKESVARPSA